jgi:hypothetical protein
VNGDSNPVTNAEQGEALLKQRLGSRVSGLRVLVREGGVVLQGMAFTYHAKQLAQHAAMHALGLKVLANEIEVCWDLDTLETGGPDPD